MKVIRSLEEATFLRNSVVTVGTFDGVHLAHREIIREVTNRARRSEGRSVVLTFDPHPKEIVPSTRGGEVRLLSTVEERIELLGLLGVDELFVVPFTPEFSRLGPRDFYLQYLLQGTGVAEVVVGYDHMFGRNRSAGIEDLMKLGKEFDFSVFAVHPFTVEGEPVSSTRIRRALAAGDLEHARRLLGYRYMLTGKVVRGDRRGATLGFPTANLTPASMRKMVPARGVYVVGVEHGTERRFGMMNIGVRPTVSPGTSETMEVHLFDYTGELYGESLKVVFLKRLRDEKRFASLEDLSSQLQRDREESLRFLAEASPVSVFPGMNTNDAS
jgi:riboflavin kinase/FMN adenylyltransferase